MFQLPLSVFVGMFGWLLVAPVAALIPKRRDWVAVIGRQDGRFLDNAKYFFLQAGAAAPDLRVVFITERKDVLNLLTDNDHAVLRLPDARAIWYLLRCGTAIVDSAEWWQHLRRFFLIRAKVIQLWHGVGCKRIELDRWRHETGKNQWASQALFFRSRVAAYRFNGRIVHYAAVGTTSRFYRDEVFTPAFLADEFPIIGYPRNDFGKSLAGANRAIAWQNVDESVRARLDAWHRAGKRLVLVAPTFRDSGTAPMRLDDETLTTIDALAEAHDIEFVFKFHPLEKNANCIVGKHFHVCARDSDIYPLFPHAAVLVTDYSSISMDFLLVDKPMLFLIPDDDGYIKNDRQLQFDPRTMMPGPVVNDWPALLYALVAQWEHDKYAKERATLRSKAFDDLPQSEAVPKLIALMRKRGWLPSGSIPCGS